MSHEVIYTRLNGATIGHHLKPVDDDTYLQFVEQRGAMEEEDALVLFYDRFFTHLSGLKGEVPDNWKDLLPEAEKRAVAKRTWMHCRWLSPEEAEEEAVEVGFADYVAIDRNTRTYQFQTYENGEKRIYSVTVRLFTQKERKDLIRVLKSETATERFQTERAAGIARQALVQTTVPAIRISHLAALAVHHLTTDDLVIEKN